MSPHLPVAAPRMSVPMPFAAAALLVVLALLPRPVAAIDPDQLLPVEEAFALEAVLTGHDHIALRWEIAEGYYLYRHRTRLLSIEGFAADGGLALPAGAAHHDEFFGDVETYRERLDASLAGSVVAGTREVVLEVGYQGCADIGICYPPHRQTLVLAVPAEFDGVDGAAELRAALGTGPAPAMFGPGATSGPPQPGAEAFGAEALVDGPARLLLRLSPAPGHYLYRDNTTLAVSSRDIGVAVQAVDWPPAVEHEDEFFGRSAVYFEPVTVPVRLRRDDARAAAISVELVIQGCEIDGICYPPMRHVFALELPAGGTTMPVGDEAAAAVMPAAAGLALALLLALGGGVLLNLMPCVLPILSLKALSLAGGGRSRSHARRSALWYTAGILVSFALLGLAAIGLRAAGLALGWGFQLQQPLVIALLAYLMLAIGLNLSGVFSVGARLAGVGQQLGERGGAAGDFFTGVLAVLVASPCTAPFMGAALAFAFAAPPGLAIAVFLALGLGLALPFLLIGFVPALAARLPRPGAWMEGLRQLLAFPMYAVAVWLAWILARQRGADAVGLLLAGAVLLALALWWLERQRYRSRPLARAAALLLLLAAFAPLWPIHHAAAPAAATLAASDRVAYSATALEALRAEGRPVFVNITADWCVTCKANERRVLADPGFHSALEAIDGVYMVGDWTNVDAEITAFLALHDSVGVPLYVFYPGDGGAPRRLPTVLSLGGVRAVLAVER